MDGALLHLSSLGYLVGCWTLVPASAFLYVPNAALQHADRISISLFIIACSFLAFAALLDTIWFIRFFRKSVEETSRPKEDRPLISEPSPQPGTPSNISLGLLILMYLFGGLLFLVGSILFWPGLNVGLYGIWVFRVGSFCYLSGSAVSIYRLPSPKSIRKLASTLSYCLGSNLYLVGGILSQLGEGTVAFSTPWLVGSVFFGVGASVGYANYRRGL